MQQDLALAVDWILPVVYFEDIIPVDFVIPGTRRVKQKKTSSLIKSVTFFTSHIVLIEKAAFWKWLLFSSSGEENMKEKPLHLGFPVEQLSKYDP